MLNVIRPPRLASIGKANTGFIAHKDGKSFATSAYNLIKFLKFGSHPLLLIEIQVVSETN